MSITKNNANSQMQAEKDYYSKQHASKITNFATPNEISDLSRTFNYFDTYIQQLHESTQGLIQKLEPVINKQERPPNTLRGEKILEDIPAPLIQKLNDYMRQLREVTDLLNETHSRLIL